MQPTCQLVTVDAVPSDEDPLFLSDVRLDRFLRVFRIVEDDVDDALFDLLRAQGELTGVEVCRRSDTLSHDGAPFLTYTQAARHLDAARKEVRRARWLRRTVSGPVRRLAEIRPDR